MERTNHPVDEGPAPHAGHLLGLSVWAIGQPLFAAWAAQPALVVAHHATPMQLGLVVLLVTLLPGLALVALTALVDRVAAPPLGTWVRRSAFGVLVGLTVLPLVGHRPGTTRLAVVAAFAIALGAAMAWSRLTSVRRLTTALALAALVFPLAFLAQPTIRPLWTTIDRSETLANARDPVVPVLVLLLDELPLISLLDRHGAIDHQRFPGFARWSARATFYPHATTVADSTAQAVPALLTGRLPRDRRPPVAAAHPDNLFTRLADAGYPLRVIETDTALCPAVRCLPAGDDPSSTTSTLTSLLVDGAAVSLALGLPQGLHRRLGLPRVDQRWRGFWTRASTDSQGPSTAGAPLPPVLTRLAAGIADVPNALHFVHLPLPHVPWERLPDGRRYDGRDLPGLINHLWSGDDWLVTQGQQRHLLQLAYLDRLLDRLHRQLAVDGWLDRALVVVAADHGVAFAVHEPWRRVTTDNIAEIANVPLLIKWPGQRRARTDPRPATTIDVVPTILGALDLPSPVDIEGEDLGDPARAARAAVDRPPCFAARLRVPPTPVPLPRDWLARRDARLAVKVDRLGDGDRSLFAIGPVGGWLDRPVDALPVTGPDPSPHALRWRPWDEMGPAVPIRLRGTIEGLIDDDLVLAVGVEGIIRAVTRPFRTREGPWRVRFEAMLDPRPDDRISTLALYRVFDRPTGVALIPVPRANDR